MDALMKPRAIAVVGATNKRVTRGNLVLKNIKTADFKGKVYAVHPNYDEIEGFPCYPSVAAIPGGVELVVAAVPAPGVADLLEESSSQRACGPRLFWPAGLARLDTRKNIASHGFAPLPQVAWRFAVQIVTEFLTCKLAPPPSVAHSQIRWSPVRLRWFRRAAVSAA